MDRMTLDQALFQRDVYQQTAERYRAELDAARARVKRLRAAGVSLLDVVESERDEQEISDQEMAARGEMHAALGAALAPTPKDDRAIYVDEVAELRAGLDTVPAAETGSV